ncbi:hypothetical protein TRVL_03725 [Trypanosoma vivax]|nr:hypothetical protein TRVL_03725 [Trypanosoma vivax]
MTATTTQQNGRPLPSYIQRQKELQDTHRCDYVLLWYERDPAHVKGQRPTFVQVGEPIRVSLVHHAFMQMAFGVLKDRLLRRVAEKTKNRVSESREHNSQKDGMGSENATVNSELQSNDKDAKPFAAVKLPPPTPHERDTVAMFCFLWRYTSSLLRSQDEVLQTHRKQRGAATRPIIKMTRQQLRLQMLLEYDVDVQKFLGSGLSTTDAVCMEHCSHLLPGQVSEEEFLNQLAKPSALAQTCSIM